MRQFFLMLVIGATVVGCNKKNEEGQKNGSHNGAKKEAVQSKKAG